VAATAAELEEALQEVARRGARIEALTCEIAWYRCGQRRHMSARFQCRHGRVADCKMWQSMVPVWSAVCQHSCCHARLCGLTAVCCHPRHWADTYWQQLQSLSAAAAAASSQHQQQQLAAMARCTACRPGCEHGTSRMRLHFVPCKHNTPGVLTHTNVGAPQLSERTKCGQPELCGRRQLCKRGRRGQRGPACGSRRQRRGRCTVSSVESRCMKASTMIQSRKCCVYCAQHIPKPQQDGGSKSLRRSAVNNKAVNHKGRC
jgi:hypothetical protein